MWTSCHWTSSYLFVQHQETCIILFQLIITFMVFYITSLIINLFCQSSKPMSIKWSYSLPIHFCLIQLYYPLHQSHPYFFFTDWKFVQQPFTPTTNISNSSFFLNFWFIICYLLLLSTIRIQIFFSYTIENRSTSLFHHRNGWNHLIVFFF